MHDEGRSRYLLKLEARDSRELVEVVAVAVATRRVRYSGQTKIDHKLPFGGIIQDLIDAPKGFISALHPADQSRVEAAIEHSVSTGDPIDVECRVRTSTGAWRWIRSRGAPRRDVNGKIIRWYGSADDIDDQKRLQEELLKRAGDGLGLPVEVN